MMPESRLVPDAAERQRALDPTRSFIVQAPAGSGKTELLIQRFLVLLTRVDEPESIVAITFTKKAAAEMRRRVLEAIESAEGPEPQQAHRAQTWRQARAARERSVARQWAVTQNPNRLRITTIDSLCFSLVRRMPWLSRCGAPPQIEEHPERLYAEAARRTVALLEDDHWGPGLYTVLEHLDNNGQELQKLLAEMLSHRDQWLRRIGAGIQDARGVLEQALSRIVSEHLRRLVDAVPPGLAERLLPLARYAAANLEPDHVLARCADLYDLPGQGAGDVEDWRVIARLLLTDKGEWRKSVNVKVGFPPEGRVEKERFQGLLSELAEVDGFRSLLDAVRKLPPPCYSDQQWAVLSALVPVLQCAAAQLDVIFQERGSIDFIGMAQAANRALGEEEDPTDLALALDCRIQHLLIDEFQDTSITQRDLVRGLTAGWQPEDGRTLFVVGDPMQSIYRFREADVSLFLQAWQGAIGGVRLEPLRLRANFRSDAGLVEWVNRSFPGVLAQEDDELTGAVRFSASDAVKPPGAEPAVRVHPLVGEPDSAEADRVVEIIRTARAQNRDGTIAVLVRARSHLQSIRPALQRAGIRYRAMDIDELGDVPVIQDLLALTRALLHAADRVSWLAVLRAPWCGLTLADLNALASETDRAPLWELMHNAARVAQLSHDGQERLLRVRGVLERVLTARTSSLARWIESAWIGLGGPACMSSPGDTEHARAFFGLIERLDECGELDIDALAEEVKRLYAGPDAEGDERLQIMTIHGAKGLEFDTVIVPGLGRAPKPGEARLLVWLERPVPGDEPDLLLGPIKRAGENTDDIYTYLNGMGKAKEENETARLLYVAGTRARRSLHLLGQVKTDAETGAAKQPSRGTLLARLWSAVAPDFQATRPAGQGGGGEPRRAVIQAPIRRLVSGWTLPEPPPGLHVEQPPPVETEVPTFEWVGDTLRHVGVVVHRALQQVAAEGLERWDEARVRGARESFRAALRALGVPAAELQDALGRVESALINTLRDPRGRWILDSSHTGAQTEFALQAVVGGQVEAVRVDRTFVDQEGVRWIVDFKTSSHEGASREAFLDNERERYKAQMTKYAAILARSDQRPIRAALYFPLLGGWREYAAEASV